MPLPALAAAAPYIIGGLQTVGGMIQRGASKRRRRDALDNLKYDISSGTKEQVQLARERASQTGLPGEDIMRGRAEADMARTVAKGESVAETSSDVLGLYQKMYGSKTDINRQILEKGAQYKSESELQLMKTMGLMAEEENQQFYYNRMVPFLSEMGYAGEEAAGGAANIAGGLQTAYQGWMNQFGTPGFDDKDTGAKQFQTDRDMLKLTQKAAYYGQQEQENPLETEDWMTDNDVWNRKKPQRYGPNYPAY